jgi:2-hydroxychromene-2-carboxylate isomerase
MKRPLRFYFDFASPYAYFALRPLQELAAEHGRAIEYRPMLLWAVLKAHGIAAPLDAPVKRAYFQTDMVRSAAFHGVPYIHPVTLPFSSHLAARLFYAIVEQRPDAAQALTQDIFDALFARGEDITHLDVLRAIAVGQGLDPDAARAAIEGPLGRQRLAEAVDLAIADKVCGSPYMLVDGEGFFGCDRLPQIEWRLAQAERADDRIKRKEAS